jgi:oligopeptide/dipeptide ABC transporter ATP-binding protein
MTSPIVDARDIAVTYTSGPPWDQRVTTAIKSVTLSIAPGETVGLVGESGSGKTTLGRLCLGLVAPSAGSVLFDGKPIGPRHRPPRGQLSVVLQQPEWALNPRLRVATSVAEPLTIQGRLTSAERLAEVRRTLERVGLDVSFATRYPHELSGGQRQRVAIARALITEPRFIVFDEAVSALDVSVQTQVLNLIKDLQAEHNFAALFISHDLAATRYVSHRMAVMYAGELMEIGPADLFYAKPQHPYSRALSVSIALEDADAFKLKGTGDDVSPVGCPLNLRCPWSIDRCRDDKPVLRHLGEGSTACHRAEEVAVA